MLEIKKDYDVDSIDEEEIDDSEEEENEEEVNVKAKKETKKAKLQAKVEKLELDFSMNSIDRLQKETDFTDSEYQKVVGNFLIGKFKEDEPLKMCYSTRKVTLQMVWDSIVAVAKKKAKDNATVMSDDEVFGLAIHFVQDGKFKEDKNDTFTMTKEEKKSLEEQAKIEYLAEQKQKLEEAEKKRIEKEKQKLEAEKKKREKVGQISLFDLE